MVDPSGIECGGAWCTETDDDMDPFTAGHTSSMWFEHTDECVEEDGVEYVMEGVCSGGSWIAQIECEFGCSEGACQPEPTPEPEPESTQNPPAIKNGSFDWDWTYETPQCDGLVVAYPSNIPSGQSNDVNIRLETDQGQVTLNYHLDQGTWSGTTAFVYSQHRLWPAGVTEYTVTWTQVGGSNYHWQGAVECALGEVSPETGTRNGYAVVRTPSTPGTDTGAEDGSETPDVVEGYRTGRTTVSKGQRVGSDIVVVRGLDDCEVELQKQTKRGWKSIRTVTAKDGNAVVTYPKQRKKGTYSYRLTAGDYVSDVLTVKVR
jgi:hypothetical protein